jgi:hypothetical protein
MTPGRALGAGGENPSNRINSIEFAGVFSGNAAAPSRSDNLIFNGHF